MKLTTKCVLKGFKKTIVDLQPVYKHTKARESKKNTIYFHI
jgi:hypothetical protein